MNRIDINRLRTFINPYNGNLLSKPFYVHFGNRDGHAKPSPALADVKLDVENLKNKLGKKAADQTLPSLNVTDVLDDNKQKIGQCFEGTQQGTAEPSDRLAELYTKVKKAGKIKEATVVVGKRPDSDTLENPIVLEDLDNGLLYQSNGDLKIASGGKVPKINDYVRPEDLIEEVETLQGQIAALEGEIAGLQTEIAAAASAASTAASAAAVAMVTKILTDAVALEAVQKDLAKKEDKSAHKHDIGTVTDEVITNKHNIDGFKKILDVFTEDVYEKLDKIGNIKLTGAVTGTIDKDYNIETKLNVKPDFDQGIINLKSCIFDYAPEAQEGMIMSAKDFGQKPKLYYCREKGKWEEVDTIPVKKVTNSTTDEV